MYRGYVLIGVRYEINNQEVRNYMQFKELEWKAVISDGVDCMQSLHD